MKVQVKLRCSKICIRVEKATQNPPAIEGHFKGSA